MSQQNYKSKSILFDIFDVIWISIFKFHHFFKALLIPVISKHCTIKCKQSAHKHNNDENLNICNTFAIFLFEPAFLEIFQVGSDPSKQNFCR